MDQDERSRSPQKGYFEAMPTYMKVLVPLTVAMLGVGFVLLGLDNLDGFNLIAPVVIIFLLRLVLSSFDIGPETIFGYTVWFWIERMERRYKYFPIVFGGVIVSFFAAIIYFSETAS